MPPAGVAHPQGHARPGTGAQLTILCTDPVSVIDIPHLVTEEGDRLVGQGRDDGVFSFTIEKGGT